MPIDDPDLAIAAAEAGAAVVRRAFGAPLDRFDKGAGDFATAADIEAENAILDVLRRERPGDEVVGEESGRSGAGGSDRLWLVDPLCGTLNFAARTMLVAVNVALRSGSSTLASASADPFAGEVYWTDGVRARVRRDGVDEPLTPSAVSALVDVNIDPPYPADGPLAVLADPDFAARFRPRVVSTTLAVAWVAAGRRAAYVTYGDLRDSVHFAAGIALCEAAGCVVTGLRGQPWQEEGAGLLAAADEQTHAALLAILSRRGR
ncbi:inositol monophosphatase family protein [Paractinoplanes globisporus]|uniref:Inositol monophosphatase family protein n=1 Tax=Paractinoplanes globisporus TaxID=113565 RepID=A0ABW6WGF5_9ACTN|nr:inositol monophosphatase family protein [Actinoplanes globisporus]